MTVAPPVSSMAIYARFRSNACRVRPRLVPVRAYLTRYPHVMNYKASLRRLFRESWDVVHCWEEPYVLAGHQLALGQVSRDLCFTRSRTSPRIIRLHSIGLSCSSMRRAAGWIAAGHTVEEATGQRADTRTSHGGLYLLAWMSSNSCRTRPLERRSESHSAGPVTARR